MDVYGSHKVTLLDGTEYDFGGEWKTISMYDSLSEALGEEIVPNGGPEHPGTSVEHLGAIATSSAWSATTWRTTASSSNTCGSTSTRTSFTSPPSCVTSRSKPPR